MHAKRQKKGEGGFSGQPTPWPGPPLDIICLLSSSVELRGVYGETGLIRLPTSLPSLVAQPLQRG